VKLDRSTENLLAFNASGSKSVPDSATGAAQGDAKSDDKPWWKVWQDFILRFLRQLVAEMACAQFRGQIWRIRHI
jgi:hypothetical protein